MQAAEVGSVPPSAPPPVPLSERSARVMVLQLGTAAKILLVAATASLTQAEYCATVAVHVAGIVSQVSVVEVPGVDRHWLYIVVHAERASASVFGVGMAKAAANTAANLQAFILDRDRPA